MKEFCFPEPSFFSSRLLKKSNFELFQAKKLYSTPQFAAKLRDSRPFKVHYKLLTDLAGYVLQNP